MSGVVVVDASLAVAWVIEERFTAEARALLIDWEQQQVQRTVPCWFACEVGSALYRRRRRGELTQAAVRRAIADVLAAVTPQMDAPTTVFRAIEIADRLNQPRPYDAQYAALAEAEGCEFWTADERFYNAARRAYPWVRWVGDYHVTSSAPSETGN
jgi:predicted nucleic acid-binding protein